jgi:hypothetical protein
VASTIIGARTVEQLNDNLRALDVTLSPAQREALDRVSEPALPFPHAFSKGAPNFMHGGATVNGVPSQRLPMQPQHDTDRW